MVCFAWVFFRAPDIEIAIQILRGMTGDYGVAIPDAVGSRMGALRPILEDAGITFFPGGGAQFVGTWLWIAAVATITFFFPNTQQIVSRFEPKLDFNLSKDLDRASVPILFLWRPSRRWAIAIAVLALASVLALNRPSDFLYFQF
jgi:hypothetical protein